MYSNIIQIYMRVEQKVHERGFLCVSLWVCNEQSGLKFFLKWRKIFFSAKVLAKDYVYCMHIYMYIVSSAYVWKHVLQEGEDGHGNQKHIDVCSSHDISRALGIL